MLDKISLLERQNKDIFMELDQSLVNLNQSRVLDQSCTSIHKGKEKEIGYDMSVIYQKQTAELTPEPI